VCINLLTIFFGKSKYLKPSEQRFAKNTTVILGLKFPKSFNKNREIRNHRPVQQRNVLERTGYGTDDDTLGYYFFD
jgi:hypothetical protein